ncbi:MAG: hypothetical protein M1822_004080 [Bathelium mastoideum]|nr:MAG: hypothetical protein M1822_004080 [Bathelium mastoideum]
MDPATAFQLACGALQLVDFGIKTVKAFREIYQNKDALTLENEKLDHNTQLLHATTLGITNHLRSLANVQLTPEKLHLQQVTEECTHRAQVLLDELGKLKLAGPRRKRDVFGQWTKTTRSRGKIDGMQTQLMRCQKLLDTQMLVNICQGIDANNEDQLKVLRQIDLKQVQNLEVVKQMKSEFQVLVEGVMNDLEMYIAVQGEETRRLIQGLSNESKDREQFQQLLQSLTFATMTTRQDDVHEAYPSTFQWLFDP